MTSQKQNVGDNSQVIQAFGNVTVTGVTPAQMTEIMIATQKMIGHFTAEAKVQTEERFLEFQDEVLKRFSEGGKGNPEAFKDPDFQFQVKTAQLNYARDGKESTRNILAELLEERSKSQSRDRIALIINECIDKIAKLTDEDLSILSLSFILL